MKCFVCGKEFSDGAVFYETDTDEYLKIKAFRNEYDQVFQLCPECMRMAWVVVSVYDHKRTGTLRVLPAEEENK